MNLNFWQKPKSWPRSPMGYKFLASVFEPIGALRFGKAWKGIKTFRNVDRLPQSSLEASYSQQRRAHVILKKHFPSIQRRDPEALSFAGILKQTYIFSDGDWATAYKFQNDTFLLSQEVAEQIMDVRHLIAQACEAGTLTLATRDETYGKMKSVDKSIWNTEFRIWEQRFDKCKINPRKPLHNGTDGPGYEWIFVTSNSLDAFIKILESERPSQKVKQTVSQEKYCETWLTTTMQKDINPPNVKAFYRAEAKAQFETGVRAFDRAWINAIKYTGQVNWSKPGRRRKS